MASNNANESISDLTFAGLSGIGLTDSILHDLNNHDHSSFYRLAHCDNNASPQVPTGIPQHGYMHQYRLQQQAARTNNRPTAATSVCDGDGNNNLNPTADQQEQHHHRPPAQTAGQTQSVLSSTPNTNNSFINKFHPAVQAIIRGECFISSCLKRSLVSRVGVKVSLKVSSI